MARSNGCYGVENGWNGVKPNPECPEHLPRRLYLPHFNARDFYLYRNRRLRWPLPLAALPVTCSRSFLSATIIHPPASFLTSPAWLPPASVSVAASAVSLAVQADRNPRARVFIDSTAHNVCLHLSFQYRFPLNEESRARARVAYPKAAACSSRAHRW